MQSISCVYFGSGCWKSNNDWDNHTKEAKYLSENQDEDKTNKNLLVLCSVAYSTISNDSNCVASSDLAQSTAKACSKCINTFVSTPGITTRLLDFHSQNYSNDKSINTQDTCHNDWNDSFKHESWSCHCHRTDGNTTFCSSIGCSNIRQDKCESSSKPSKGSPCKWVLSNCLYFLSNHSFFRSSK